MQTQPKTDTFADICSFLKNQFSAEKIRESVKDNKTTALCICLVFVGGGYSTYKRFFQSHTRDDELSTVTQSDKKGDSVKVNKLFFRRLWKILTIILPIRSRAFLHLMSLTVLLYYRTLLSLKVAEITGQNAKYIVQKRLPHIVMGVLQFALLGIPASLVNSALKYEIAILSLTFRKRLTEHVMEHYLQGTNFYKASNLGGDLRIDNAAQRVTQDIETFCESLSTLYATIFKPLLDVLLNTYQLSSLLSVKAPFLLFGYYGLSASIKRFIMPAFGQMSARASALEGDYRTAHQRLITNSEEIAFYDGSTREKAIITRLFRAVFLHARHSYYMQYLVGIFDEYLVKYGSSITGYAILSLPVLEGRVGDKTTGDLTNDYVRNKQLLINLSKGSAQLIVLSNRVTSLAGSTSRVAELLEMVTQLDEAGVEPFRLEKPIDRESDSTGSSVAKKTEKGFIKSWRERGLKMRQLQTPQPVLQIKGGGKFIHGEDIKFEEVTIVNPDGRTLVNNLNFEVKPEQNVIVTGPNGSGKSSLFRVLGELWPLHTGTVTKPSNDQILFVPQKPYLVLGTLRDQIIYPHSKEQMIANGVTDQDLANLIKIVDPACTILAQWGWDEVRDWFHAMSGGQKQRVGMARLFYHQPRFGILDECTSAVSIEVEGKIYKTCKKLGITLFTVSHRKTLNQYHDYELHFTGHIGEWTWEKIRKEKGKDKADSSSDSDSS